MSKLKKKRSSYKSVDFSRRGDCCPAGKSAIHNARLCAACFCESANLHISSYAENERRMRGGDMSRQSDC